MRALPLVLLFACGGEPPGNGKGGDKASDTDTITSVQPGTDEGFVFLFENAPHLYDDVPNISLAGLFVEDDMGIENLVQCVAYKEGAWCADRLPSEGDFIVTEDWDDDILEELVAVDAGPDVTIGPYTAEKYDFDGGLVYFRTDLYGIAAPNGSTNVSFGTETSEWDEYLGVGVIDVPNQLILTQPEIFEYAMFEATKPFELRWQPGTTGEVYIAVLTRRENRLYRVADTGAYDLDLDDVGLSDGDSVELRIGRWSVANIDDEGNELTVHYQRDQKIVGSYRDFGGRTEIFPPNTCYEGGMAPPLEPGNYWGDLGPLSNDQSPGLINSCTGAPAFGADGMYRIEVQPDEILDITYDLLQGDASVYILGNCNQGNSCLAGADNNVGVGTPAEELSYHNTSGVTQNLTLVLDAAIWTNSAFTLDIVSTQLIGDVLEDNCVDAMALGPIGTGNYVGDLSGFTNLLDPGIPAAAGPEGLIQIELLPNETLQADVDMPGHDAVLYALYNCAVVGSVAATADANVNGVEQLMYTNQSPGNELVYLVVDGVASTGSYTLDILIQ